MAEAEIPLRWLDALPAEEATVLAGFRRPRPPLDHLERPALLVIDAVETFFGPDEPVDRAQAVARTACGAAAWRSVEPITRLLGAFRGAGRPVVYTVVDNLQRHVGAATIGSVAPSSGHEVLRGDRIVEPLIPEVGDVVVPKTKASALAATPVVSMLVDRGVRSLVLAGCTTSGCVLATAIDACSLGFAAVVAADACFDRVPTLASAALVTMDAKWARVIETEEVLGLLRSDAARTS